MLGGVLVVCVSQVCQYAALSALADHELCYLPMSEEIAALQSSRVHATQPECKRISWHITTPAHPHQASKLGPSKLQRLAGLPNCTWSSLLCCCTTHALLHHARCSSLNQVLRKDVQSHGC